MADGYRRKLARLVRRDLSPSEFAHKDHIGVAYEALASHDFLEAVWQVGSGIRALAEDAGMPDKFNATITWAFMSLIAERMRTTDHRNAEDFIAKNPDLCRSDAVFGLYSRERIQSELARTVALLPDRALSPAGCTPAASPVVI